MAIYYQNQFRNYYFGSTGSLGAMYYGALEVNPGQTTGGGGGYDPDAQTYFNAVETAGGTLSSGDKTATNTLFTSLKSNSLYNKMVLMYPLLGGNSSGGQSINAVNPGTYNITWNGTLTFSSTGVASNGTTGYGDTTWTPTTTVWQSGSFGVYMQSGFVDFSCPMGSGPDGSGRRMMMFGNGSSTGGLMDWGVSSYGRCSIPQAPGLMVATSAGDYNKVFKNGVFSNDFNGADKDTTITTNMLLCKRSDGYFYSGVISFSYVSTYLTNSEVSQLSTIVNTWATSLGRNTY